MNLAHKHHGKTLKLKVISLPTSCKYDSDLDEKILWKLCFIFYDFALIEHFWIQENCWYYGTFKVMQNKKLLHKNVL